MKYCCTEFDQDIGDNFIKANDGTYHLCGRLRDCMMQEIKFCPFCGSDLAPRFVVHKTVLLSRLPWAVWDSVRDVSVAYFEDKVLAQQHVEHLQVKLK